MHELVHRALAGSMAYLYIDNNECNRVCMSLSQCGLIEIQAWSQAHFGQGSGNIVLDDLSCTGSETSLFDCSYLGVNNHNCGHSEDAGVTCSGTQQ